MIPVRRSGPAPGESMNTELSLTAEMLTCGVFSSADRQAPWERKMNASGEHELSLANHVHFLPGETSKKWMVLTLH